MSIAPSSRGTRCLVAVLLAGLAGSAWGVVPDPLEPAAPESFSESIDVALFTSIVRVIDGGGNPILGLGPDDLRVRVGKTEIPVVALDWVSQEEPPATEVAVAQSRAESESALAAPLPIAAPALGRLVVVFVQTDFDPTRISGQMRLRPYTRQLLATLRPKDRVAVVSFDSHLKLWQDFSEDLGGTLAAIDRAMLWSDEIPVPAALPYSLAAAFPRDAARAASSTERALEIVGRALEPLPGEKTVLFLGWGIGRFDGQEVHMRPAYKPAVKALLDARASVFVLDVTSADAHSLSVGLENVAAATGGLYFSTFRLPGVATRALARTLSGYYVLTLDRSALAELSGDLRIDLRKKNGTVLTRPLTVH